MNIRWRIAVAIVQIATLCGAAWLAVGTAFPLETWFISGAIGVVLALQFAEPFFTRPTDTVISGLSVALLVLTSGFPGWAPAWWVVLAYSTLGVIVAVISLVAPHEAPDEGVIGTGRRAFYLVRAFAGKYQYSAVFLVAVLSAPGLSTDRRLIAIGAWALILLISMVRWDRLFSRGPTQRPDLTVVSITAPARITVVGPEIGFALGSAVLVSAGDLRPVSGRVVRRAPRLDGVATEIQFAKAKTAESFVNRRVRVGADESSHESVMGVVAPGTSDMELQFEPLEDIEIGSPVWSTTSDGREILFQVTSLQIAEEREAQFASVEFVRANAVQVGEVADDGSLVQTKRVLPPGSLVRGNEATREPATHPSGSLELGEVLGTSLPVWINPDVLTKGHSAILGMTGMGKSTFTKRLAIELARVHPVVVVDQTGEYRGLGLDASTLANASVPGLTLKDLDGSATPHKEALAALRVLEGLGRGEYQTGTPMKRVLILEEAHQFIPEPSMLGFQQPGRDESVQFGLLMMQVRKFGVSVILVSQRTAVVAKSALSQCENIVAFKSVDQTGLDYFEAFGGQAARQLLPRLGVGQAVAMGPSVSLQSPVAVEVAR
ncbi:MAG: helicase HerA domain-containing protein [Microcella sp.]